MPNPWARIVGWWKTADRASRPAPFVVTCRCGKPVQGLRQRQRQIITCPSCGKRVFVLPNSPWPAGDGDVPPSVSTKSGDSSGPVSSARIWLLPVLAVTGTAAFIVVLLVAVWPRLFDDAGERVARIRERVALGRQALARQDLPVACRLNGARRELQLARQALEPLPAGFPADEARDILHLHRQVELFAELTDKPLEQLLQHPQPEWEAVFQRDYAGRSIGFDAAIRADHTVDYLLGSAPHGGQGASTVAVKVADADIGSLSQTGKRPLFAAFMARLASLRLETHPEKPQGAWVLHLEPGSVASVTAPELRGLLQLGDTKSLKLATLRVESVEEKPLALHPGVAAHTVQDQLGHPDRMSRQLLSTTFVEQWVYDKKAIVVFEPAIYSR